jgi:hypothetical protein
MFNRFKTADEVFFKSFEEAADILYQGALLLQDMMSNHDALEGPKGTNLSGAKR